ncbi:adenylate/guanylate cyclase domain-containing protein [Sinorhizobium chiapasense]|uniref:Adenylate/guanylate cyclase domain-containing protein n=1 Tax=Sinorhizobium chiapasense TaxID=501572 RepID=A0ABZ2BDR8_9HYPH
MINSTDHEVRRRLAAILAADVVGYSSLMGRDDEGTLARIKDLRRDVIDPTVTRHQGRIFKTTGDGILVEFPSPVEAVRCAVELQQTLAKAPSQVIQLRIGINLGDILIDEDGDVYGDGVNVAARLERLANPGGIYCRRRSTRKSATSCPTVSTTAASSRSKTSHGQLGPTACRFKRKPLGWRSAPAMVASGRPSPSSPSST